MSLRPWAIAVAFLIVGISACAPTNFQSDDYTRRTEDQCHQHDLTGLTDPVGVVFVGQTITSGSHGHSHHVFNKLDAINWNDPNASTQWIGSQGVCTETEYQNATNYASDDSRYHVRLNQTHQPSPDGTYSTVGTPHYEIKVCGSDRVPPENPQTPNPDSGFDLGRGHLKATWLAVYGSSKLLDTADWQNTRVIAQNCMAWQAGSSGRVYWLDGD
jgi:hypothetical protein